MERPQKIILSIAWIMLGIFALTTLILWSRLSDRATAAMPEAPASSSGASSNDGPLPILFDAPAFALTNQSGQPISDQDLRGHPYVAAFIFTQCAGPCPMMSSRMGKLQKDIADPSVKLVSFTLDPERDTPEVLQKYAEKFNADASRWYFLTGERQKIFDIANGMKLTAVPATESEPIVHSTKFLLVDGQGKVRGAYSNDDPEDVKRLATDAGKLASEAPMTKHQ